MEDSFQIINKALKKCSSRFESHLNDAQINVCGQSTAQKYFLIFLDAAQSESNWRYAMND
jgi:hypothetical protein